PGGREGRSWLASQRSSFARVALRGAEPWRKLRKPFELTELAFAALRNDMRATSRPTASRNSGTGSVGTLRRLALMHRPRGVQFVRLSGGYTPTRYHTSRSVATPRGGHARVTRPAP